jgi:hypothetical protein
VTEPIDTNIPPLTGIPDGHIFPPPRLPGPSLPIRPPRFMRRALLRIPSPPSSGIRVTLWQLAPTGAAFLLSPVYFTPVETRENSSLPHWLFCIRRYLYYGEQSNPWDPSHSWDNVSTGMYAEVHQ